MFATSKSRSRDHTYKLPPGMICFKSVDSGNREKTYWIPLEDLNETLAKLVDSSEEIFKVELHEEPLPFWNRMLVAKRLFKHSFVIFETKSFYWSVEKDDNCVTLQRSRRKDTVLNDCHLTQRLQPVKLVKKRRSNQVSIGDLIRFLINEPQMTTQYSLLGANCKRFSATVFNYLTFS